MPGVLVLQDVVIWKGWVRSKLDGPAAVASDLRKVLGVDWVGTVQDGSDRVDSGVASNIGNVDIAWAVGNNLGLTVGRGQDGGVSSGSEASKGSCDDGVLHCDWSGCVDKSCTVSLLGLFLTESEDAMDVMIVKRL